MAMDQVWLVSLGSVFLVSFISFIGIFTLTLKERMLKKILLFLVSFSTGALLGDAFIHLLPEMVEETGFTLMNSFGILGGIMIFFILEKFICWRHCHVPTSKHHPHPVGIMNLIGDGFHNFMDGIIIAGSFMADYRIGIATTVAVILHEIPQEISELGILIHAGYSRSKALILNFMSALIAVLGAILALVLGAFSEGIVGILTPVTIGGFIYIASADLIPELHKETEPRKSMVQFFGIIFGIMIMLSLLLLE
jgi:zinc and cadmium transporter